MLLLIRNVTLVLGEGGLTRCDTALLDLRRVNDRLLHLILVAPGGSHGGLLCVISEAWLVSRIDVIVAMEGHPSPVRHLHLMDLLGDSILS